MPHDIAALAPRQNTAIGADHMHRHGSQLAQHALFGLAVFGHGQGLTHNAQPDSGVDSRQIVRRKLRGLLHQDIGQLDIGNDLIQMRQDFIRRLGIVDAAAFHAHQQIGLVQGVRAKLRRDCAVVRQQHGAVVAAPHRLVGAEAFLQMHIAQVHLVAHQLAVLARKQLLKLGARAGSVFSRHAFGRIAQRLAGRIGLRPLRDFAIRKATGARIRRRRH